MNFILNRRQVECLRAALNREFLKCEEQLRANLMREFDYRLGQGEAKPNGWAPMGRIRSSWPSSHIKRSKKPDPYFHKPRKQLQKAVKHMKTAAEILAELSL